LVSAVKVELYGLCASLMPREGAHCIVGPYICVHALRPAVGRLSTAVRAVLERMQRQDSVLRSMDAVFP